MIKEISSKDIISYIDKLIVLCNDDTVLCETKEDKSRMKGFYDACKNIKDYVVLQTKKD